MPNHDIVPGHIVDVPCDMKTGAFPGEYLVTIETQSGPISGFVREEMISKSDTGKSYIRGVVAEVSPTTITVMLKGSFFTTTGLAYLSTNWAKSNLKAVAA